MLAMAQIVRPAFTTTVLACLIVAGRHCLKTGVGSNPFQFALISVCLLLHFLSVITSDHALSRK